MSEHESSDFTPARDYILNELFWAWCLFASFVLGVLITTKLLPRDEPGVASLRPAIVGSVALVAVLGTVAFAAVVIVTWCWK
jgi:hypothetical protein